MNDFFLIPFFIAFETASLSNLTVRNITTLFYLQMNDHTVIVAACRSPIGEFNKDFASVSASDIGASVIREALKKSQLLNETESISEVIMGQVYSAGCGQNPARQAAISAGESYTFFLNYLL